MAAARHLQLSQPSVTSQLRKLEDHYQIELFERRNGRLFITEIAAKLLPKIEALLQQEAELEFELRHQSELQAGQLRIGATGPYYLLPLLTQFRQQNQHIQVDMQLGNSNAILEALLAYQVDVAVTSHTVCDPRLLQFPLASSPLILLVHRDDPLAELNTVPCAVLQHATLLTRENGSATQQAIEDLLCQQQIRPAKRLQLGSREAIREGVVHRLGVALMPAGEVSQHPLLRSLTLSDSQSCVNEYLYVLSQRLHIRPICNFIKLVHNGDSSPASAYPQSR